MEGGGALQPNVPSKKLLRVSIFFQSLDLGTKDRKKHFDFSSTIQVYGSLNFI